MIAKFIKHYGVNQFKQLSGALNDAIVAFDPEGATEAAIAEMEENFDKVNKEYSIAVQEYKKEQAEADAITKLSDQRIAAAEHIQSQLESDPDNAQLNEALEQLVTALEEMAPDIERETDEAAYAKEVMDDLKLTVDMYAQKLKEARTALKQAAQTMDKSKRQAARAKEQANQAAMRAGLRSGGDGLCSALASMNKQAAAAEADADAAKRKARLLNPTAVNGNSAVDDAMALVSGNPSKTASASIADRLNAFKKK